MLPSHCVVAAATAAAAVVELSLLPVVCAGHEGRHGAGYLLLEGGGCRGCIPGLLACCVVATNKICCLMMVIRAAAMRKQTRRRVAEPCLVLRSVLGSGDSSATLQGLGSEHKFFKLHGDAGRQLLSMEAQRLSKVCIELTLRFTQHP